MQSNLKWNTRVIGIAVMGAFLSIGCTAHASDAKAKETEAAKPRVIELTVTQAGFKPSPITVKAGEPLKLIVTRTTDKTCGTEIVIPGYDIEKKLPLNEPVTVEFTPTKAGKLKYGCAMGQMVSGVLMVE